MFTSETPLYFSDSDEMTFSAICPVHTIPSPSLKWMFQVFALVSPGFGGTIPILLQSNAYSNV